MKVTDFNGRKTSWPPHSHEVSFDDRRPRSSLHMRCRKLLREMYPTQSVLEEIPIPGLGLFCDFYLPQRKVVVECNGEQHYKFSKHFHGSRMKFAQSVTRDRNKSEWCKLNNIRMAVLPFSEKDDEWRERVEEAND